MRAKNILHLGVKELWSLARDPMMLVLIAYAFTLSIYSTSTALPDSLHKAPIAIVDEDQSPLSQRIVNAFQPPLFLPPTMVSREEMDARMDAGLDTFALDIPPKFQEDVLAGRVARDPAQHRRDPRGAGVHAAAAMCRRSSSARCRRSFSVTGSPSNRRWTSRSGCASTPT